MGAVCCCGLAFPYARRYLAGTAGPLSLATGQTVVATLLLVPAGALAGVAEQRVTAVVVVAMLALGCPGTGVAYVLDFTVVARAGGTVAVAVGVALLGEDLRWNEPVGALVVVAGAKLAQGRLHRVGSVSR